MGACLELAFKQMNAMERKDYIFSLVSIGELVHKHKLETSEQMRASLKAITAKVKPVKKFWWWYKPERMHK